MIALRSSENTDQARQTDCHHWKMKVTTSLGLGNWNYLHQSKIALFVSLYVLESSLLVLLLAIYKKGEKPFLAFLNGSSGIVFVIAALLVLASTMVIAGVFRNTHPSHARWLGATFALNVWAVVITFVVSEGVIR